MKRAGPVALVGGVVLFIVLSFIPREPEAERSWMARTTTYSPGPWGAKALFLLLSRLGLDVERLRRPAYDQLSPETVLWVLTREPFARSERRRLLSFLEQGGTLIAPPQSLADILADAQLGKPELKKQPTSLTATWKMDFELEEAPLSIGGVADPVETYASAPDGVPIVAGWQIGMGRAVSLGVDQLSRNDRIGRSGHGAFLARLAFTLGQKHVFDEFKAGYGEVDLVTLLGRVPYRWGVAQLALVGVVGLVAIARRRLPAEPPGPVRRRRTLDHVEAGARLWEQARDAGLPLQAILSAVEERARARLGGAGGDRPFLEWIERSRPTLATRANEVWRRAELLCEEPRPSAEDARRAAVEIKTLEREGLKW